MAAKKRRAKDAEEEEQDEEHTSSSSDDGDEFPEVSDDENPAASSDDDQGQAGTSIKEELINVDFEFFDPNEGDYHGIKTLLNALLDGEPFSTAPLADYILQQKEVGTVIKTGPEEEVLGLATIIPTGAAATLGSALQELSAFVKAHAPTEEDRALVDAALGDGNTGILLYPRLLNCPYQLGPPLQKILFDELQGALDEPFSKESKALYSFTQLFILDRVYAEPPQPKQQPKQQKTQHEPAELVYVFPETEYYHKHCQWSYSFAAPGKSVSKDSLEPRRLVMMLSMQDAARIDTIHPLNIWQRDKNHDYHDVASNPITQILTLITHSSVAQQLVLDTSSNAGSMHLAAGDADLIAAASLAFLASSACDDGSEEDDQVCLALPLQRKQGFVRACCAERTDYSVIKQHLLEAEKCASQRVKSLSWSTGAPSSMHASADRFDANGSDAGNHGSDDTITGAPAGGGDVQQGGGEHHDGVGVAGSNDEPRGSGGSDGTARPPSSDAPDDGGAAKDDDGGVHQVVGNDVKMVINGGWHAVENDMATLQSLRTELLQGLALHLRGVHVPSVELRLQVLLCSLKFHNVSIKQLRDLQLVQIVRQLSQHTNQAVHQAAMQLLEVGSWQELHALQTRNGHA